MSCPNHRGNHRVIGFSYYKPECVCVRCACGKSELVGSWWSRPMPGWSKKQWPSLISAIRLHLDSWNNANPKPKPRDDYEKKLFKFGGTCHECLYEIASGKKFPGKHKHEFFRKWQAEVKTEILRKRAAEG